MFSYMLQDLESLRKRQEYKNLNGVSKKVVKYLMSELERMVRENLIAVNRNKKYRVALFELDFEECTSLCISSIHKSGGARIFCFKECKGAENKPVIEAIKTVCDILGFNVEITDEKMHMVSRKMKIFFWPSEEKTH